jgi:tetratricopeptide (TPR) repeat protein
MGAERCIALARRALDAGRLDRAQRLLSAALSIDARSSRALFYLGRLASEVGRPAEALQQYRRCLELGGASANLFNNMASAQLQLGRVADAERSYLRALECEASHPQACAGLGRLLQERGEFDRALQLYERVGRDSPEGYLAAFHRSQILLGRGAWREGFKWYAARPNRLFSPVRRRHALFRGALPPSLAGREVLVLSEHTGIGEDLFFARFFPELKSRGARVLFACSDRARELLEATHSVDGFADDDVAPAEDRIVLFAGDLPYALKLWDAARVPAPLLLEPTAQALARAHEILHGLGDPPYLGVTWRAGTQADAQAAGLWQPLSKQVPVAGLVTALASHKATLLVLQRRVDGAELDAATRLAGRPIHDLSEPTAELPLTLALLSLLDDYLCVPNTHMHMRIAAGGQCRVLEPFPADWRLGQKGEASPWYPGCRIYRQSPQGAWDEALQRLAQDLAPG